MDKQYVFPKTDVAGVALPRLIIGTNWILGWSHRSASTDQQIMQRFQNEKAVFPILDAFGQHEINAVMGPLGHGALLRDSISYYSDTTGKQITIIDTPIINVDDTKNAREEAKNVIQASRKNGATFCLIHHSSVEQLVNRNKRKIERISDYTDMIRQAGMIPGLSAHMPELITYSDENNYDVETYIQIYNCLGFLMQVEIETIASIIYNAKKPVITIKPLAAGRTTPFVGLNFVWNTIRNCDMVTIGCTTPEEVVEDIEISYAALERRFPEIKKRSSPNLKQAAFGNK